MVKRCQTQSLVAKDSLVMTVQALRLNLRLCSRVQLARFDLVVSNMWVEAQTPMDSLRCVQIQVFNSLDSHGGANPKVTSVQNTMVEHSRCE